VELIPGLCMLCLEVMHLQRNLYELWWGCLERNIDHVAMSTETNVERASALLSFGCLVPEWRHSASSTASRVSTSGFDEHISR